jgi:hypothetical protein
MNDALEWISKLGLPTVALVAIGWGVRIACTWLANEVIKPLTARHIMFLDGLENRDRMQAETLQSMRDELKQTTETQRTHNAACEAIHKFRTT